MANRIVEVVVTLPLSMQGEQGEAELERFAAWVERPIQGSDDSRVPTLLACAAGLVRAYRAAREKEVRPC